MRFSTLSLAALPLAASASSFLEVLDDNGFVEQQGLLRFPMKVAHGGLSKHLKHSKRQNAADVTNRQTGYFYTIELKMGTPGQAVSVNFDTGSSELWVNPNCAKSNDEKYCKSFGQFGGSSSFVDQHQNTTLRYGRGECDIEYGYDYVTVGSAKIAQQVFGVATDSEFHTTGILGAGPSLDGFDSPYPFVIDNLFRQKFIESRVFSLDLRHIGSDRGAVVYGGIDTKKYSGHLEKRPIIPAAQSPDGKTRYWIYLDGISITKDDGSVTPVFDKANGQPVLLDSGYTVSALPTEHFQKILAAFPSAKKDPESDQYSVDCNVVKSTKGSINYKFGKTVIKVPYADFIWQQPAYNQCVLGVIEDNEFPVLGDTFLRAAYAVFDWDNKEIHLANNEDCGSNLVKITSGPNAVPNLEGDCGKPVTSSSAAPTSTEVPANVSTSAPITTTTPVTAPTGGPLPGNLTTTTGIWSNSTAKPTLTSTYLTTSVHTITSCAPTVTNCPVGEVTTEVLTQYTTYCPGETETAAPTTTSSYSKPPCPETTFTIVLPKTIYCKEGMSGCNPGETITTSNPGTVNPITPAPKPTSIPGCNGCNIPTVTATLTSEAPVTVPTEVPTTVVPPETNLPPPPPTTMATLLPTGGCPGGNCGNSTNPPPVTAGAAGVFAPAALAVAAMVAAAL